MMTIKQINGYKVLLNQKLGKGSYGTVYRGICDKTGQKVAIKVLDRKSIDADEYIKRALFSQIKIMSKLKSQNIVALYDVLESSNNYYIVQQLCDGDLQGIIKRQKKLSQNKAKQYLLQIANGFLVLVHDGIIHRDVKPANIMIKQGVLKIGDFGFSKKSQYANKVQRQTLVGTPLYQSIQILKGDPYSSKCDIWAIGLIFYQMLHGYVPWNGANEFYLVQAIQTKPLKIDSKFDDLTKNFLKKCLEIKQQDRISWDQLFVHPIFNQFFAKKQQQRTSKFENKFKMIMGDLRFQINAQNLNLSRIIQNKSLYNNENQMNKDNFYQFLKIVEPNINKQTSDYVFKKIDVNQDGKVQKNEIYQVLKQNYIDININNQKIPSFTKNSNNQQSFTAISNNTQQKIKACFHKLMKQMEQKKLSLQQIFNQVNLDQSKSLNHQQFRNLLKKINNSLTNQEIDAAFNFIDIDKSNQIQFKQFNNYYNKVNGLPFFYHPNYYNTKLKL